MKSVSQRLTASLLVALTSVAGCGSGRVVLPFTIDASVSERPPDAAQLATHDDAIRGIAAIIVRDLELPMPTTFTAYVYSGREGFERGLVDDANVSPVRAAELSEFAVGIGKRRQLLLNDEGGAARGREWYRLIAHELAHVSQIELAQGEGRAEQWLAEGMAEWAPSTCSSGSTSTPSPTDASIATAGIRNHAALVAARLDLETLGNPRGFTVRHLREGSLPTYQLAFLMADYLITRDGVPRVVAYFRSFERRQDRHANFRDTFGQSLEQFELEVLGHLKSPSSASATGSPSSRPQDRPGAEDREGRAVRRADVGRLRGHAQREDHRHVGALPVTASDVDREALDRLVGGEGHAGLTWD